MKILITNSVPLNGGDEALLRATVEAIGRRWPTAEVAILCKDVEQVRTMFPSRSIESDLEFVNNQAQRKAVSRLYREADCVLSAPGGFLHDHYPVEDRLRGFEVALALGKPIMIFAQSIGPFWKPQSIRRVREVLNRFSLICVRDEASVEHLSACGVSKPRIHRTADAAFLWRRSAPELYNVRTGPVRSIALAFRQWPLGDQVAARQTADKAKHLAHYVLQDPQRHLIFLSTCQGVAGYIDDSLIATEVVKRLPATMRDRCQIDRTRYTTRDLIQRYGQCDAFMGMRMHSCLLSMLAGTPAVGFGYEQKTSEVFRQLGLDRYQVNFSQPVEQWISVAERLLTDIDEVRRGLRTSLDDLAARAEQTVEHLGWLLRRSHRERGRGLAGSSEVSAEVHNHSAEVVEQVAAVLKQIGASDVIELNCGSGRLREFCDNTNYAGCDWTRPQSQARFPLYECDFNNEELPADLRNLETVVCSETMLAPIENVPDFLQRLSSRLCPNGRLILTVTDANAAARLLVDAGFTVTDTIPIRRTGMAKQNESPAFILIAMPAGPAAAQAMIERCVPQDATFVLVDDAQWLNHDFHGRKALPFLERNGQYCGPPADDADAIRELNRLRRAGASFIVFAPHSLWWLEHYVGFAHYLTQGPRRLGGTGPLVIFDLREVAWGDDVIETEDQALSLDQHPHYLRASMYRLG